MHPDTFYRVFARHFRPSRMALLCSEMDITPETHILDVGGTPDIWKCLPFRPRVTIANLTETLAGNCDFIKADARDIPVDRNSFDVCFSNSVIEHLYTWKDQQKAASEMRRVAKRYFVQTPNFWFPIEPHFLAPIFHWLPMSFRERLAPLTLRQLLGHFQNADIMRLVHEVRLLTAAEMHELFPEAHIVRERFVGITKSLIAVH